MAGNGLVPHFDAKAAFGHMTVLSLPAILMFNDSTIAALSSGHGGFACNSDGDVIYPIPYPDNSSGCGSKNLDALF